MNPSQAEFLDLYKAGLKSAVDVMKASLENAERLQQQQLSAIRSALEQHVKAMDELGAARSMDELLAVQQKMASSQIERVMGYWSNVCQAAGQNQTVAIGRVQQQMAQARDWFNETYSITARANEEAAKLAAAQPPAARPSPKGAERRASA